MAKFGEGDKRWIVEDRPDGTNVHNWHWVERDCFEWSRSVLSSLLSNLTILDGEGDVSIRTKTVDRFNGEAYVNVRKGKIIPGYELSLTLSWEGEARDSAGGSPLLKVSGSLEVPYIADENAGEDPEVKITVRDDDGSVSRRIKDAFITKGKPLVLEKIRAYVHAMAKGGPVKDELEVKKSPSAGGNAPAAGGKTVPAAPASGNAAAAAAVVEAKKEKKVKEGFRTITLTEKFNCRARDLYEIMMDENRWKGFTQSNAMISKEVGGPFSLFDGSITGVNEELQEGKLIVQRWRSGSWAEGFHSKVRFVFEEPKQGVTIVKLTQTEVPVEDKYGSATVVENTERGWRELIFNRIRALFGFGF